MLALLAEPPGSQPVDVTQLAGEHPVTAIVIVVISSLFALAPQLLGRMKAKEPPVPPALPAATAQVDATGQALLALVAGMERRMVESDRRAAEAEQKHDALERKHYDETNDLREQLREAKTKIANLESEIARLRERLMGRGYA